ncbi:MAG: hypothetical protein Q8M76_02850 [Spirochaetaceae bacterium]|nr:hypothetical protein [Spirochaetaceae bacterium]
MARCYHGGMKSMADPARALDERFTCGDYGKWPEEERRELIDGLPYSSGPAPFRLSDTRGVRDHRGVDPIASLMLEFFAVEPAEPLGEK